MRPSPLPTQPFPPLVEHNTGVQLQEPLRKSLPEPALGTPCALGPLLPEGSFLLPRAQVPLGPFHGLGPPLLALDCF